MPHEPVIDSKSENFRGKSTSQHDKHNKLEAIVKWTMNGTLRVHPGLTFDLQYHATYNSAFFKLRALVVKKENSTTDQVPIFVFLAPEVIQTLSHDCKHANELGPDTVCFRFHMKSGNAPSLVVPKDMDLSSVTWKNKQSSDVWESLRSLVHASSFDVFCRLPRRAMSEARVGSLCDALSSSQVVSTPGYADLAGLYGGKGGKLVQLEAGAMECVSDDSPPAYGDLEPGPPMPPVLPEKASNKRRRGNSDIEPPRTCQEPVNDLEATVAWLVTELKEHKIREAFIAAQLKECKAELQEYKARESSLKLELEEVKAEVAKSSRDHERQHDRLSSVETQLTKLDDLQERQGVVEAKLDELDDDLEVRVDCRVEETLDQTLSSRIQGVLEGVTLSARF
ncbi:hypothetical protein PFICI_05418 [Pestalotiopsis fici W106-1]|uniref:Uncharacterized protein n=1 Tax=Pestalotiopsis fici (strain W106-1 / CGMCC3.15140) TaxID=1229662 RepID=W3XDP6_PESFW|nr:uncharacterized protein PFICI_05418 [Pestalotiopsis fici W106-1]ETS83542.1 hypothetical protein PFICI_05418 [Pestalotiopsis fici W106-1]